MTCIKRGLSELSLNRLRPLIMETKSALPVPLKFKLFFEFLVFTCFKLVLSSFAMTFGQECLWTLC